MPVHFSFQSLSVFWQTGSACNGISNALVCSSAVYLRGDSFADVKVSAYSCPSLESAKRYHASRCQIPEGPRTKSGVFGPNHINNSSYRKPRVLITLVLGPEGSCRCPRMSRTGFAVGTYKDDGYGNQWSTQVLQLP